MDYKNRLKFYAYFFFVNIIAAIVIVYLGQSIKRQTIPYHLQHYDCSSDAFRELNISVHNLQCLQDFSSKNQLDFMEVLTVFMIWNNFDLSSDLKNNYSLREYDKVLRCLQERAKDEYQQILCGYQTIFDDIEYFPVPESTTNKDATVSFGDSWMHERNFGGKRGHEGTDIMAGVNKRGYYPVVSISDGVIEKIGWLTKGGYRIGIRSQSGAYFYYAHLYRYAKNYKVGDSVHAGELIGFMGDSGYGEEGTTGMFDVHLHLGIYIDAVPGQEVSVNPYPVLLYLQNNKLKYSY